MKKCDVIIPVYNAPDYTKLCVYNLFKNTEKETLNKVYLINDNSNEVTSNMIKNLKEKYKDRIEVIDNKVNQGFIKNVNKGFELSTADYVLLLNTDCMISHHTIEKLIENMSVDETIGLMCPVSSYAANLSLPMFPGFSYMMMDRLLERKFKGMTFDACTVVGNCLMITKKCIKEVGYFDEIYGMGYCDETDYQFKALSKGFKAKVCIDTYVFHKSEMSFSTTDTSRNERLKKNRDIFFSRWGDEYYKLLDEYNKNDPIKYINSHLNEKDKSVDLDFMFVCPQNNSTSGGVRVIIDLINYLSINGMNIGLFNLYPGEYNEIMLFNPASTIEYKNMKVKCLIGTIFDSLFLAKKMSEKLNSKLLYFSQGYEFVFENGSRYGEVESSFKLPDYLLSVSNYLKNTYKDILNIDSDVIVNGIDTDICLSESKNNDKKTITMIIRNSHRKCDYMLLDILKHMFVKFNNIKINIILNNQNVSLPVNNNDSIELNIIKGPIDRMNVYSILRNSDIFIDTSLNEGFGLMPLEAMANSNVPVISNSFGINEFAVDEKNSFIIKDVNNPYSYIESIKKLLDDNKLLQKMKYNAYMTAREFDFDKTVEKYIVYFNQIINNEIEPIKQLVTSKELDKLSNYIFSDSDFINMIKRGAIDNNNQMIAVQKQGRLKRLKIILRESIRANVYLFKLFIKNIFDSNLRL